MARQVRTIITVTELQPRLPHLPPLSQALGGLRPYIVCNGCRSRPPGHSSCGCRRSVGRGLGWPVSRGAPTPWRVPDGTTPGVFKTCQGGLKLSFAPRKSKLRYENPSPDRRGLIKTAKKIRKAGVRGRCRRSGSTRPGGGTKLLRGGLWDSPRSSGRDLAVPSLEPAEHVRQLSLSDPCEVAPHTWPCAAACQRLALRRPDPFRGLNSGRPIAADARRHRRNGPNAPPTTWAMLTPRFPQSADPGHLKRPLPAYDRPRLDGAAEVRPAGPRPRTCRPAALPP